MERKKCGCGHKIRKNYETHAKGIHHKLGKTGIKRKKD